MYGMPDITPDTIYNNLNQCFNVKWLLTGASTYSQCVSSVKAGEVQILNNTGQDVTIKTGRMPGLSAQSVDPTLVTEFLLKDKDSFTFRGITDTHQISAAGASGTLYGRSQWYSMTPQTAR
jgi:hypothetical protein|tara:strand:+ start:3296 stop:3658 length:363 start_codon:yes stop_codon:yes gene_type:complete